MTPGKLLQDVVGAQASARPGATAVVDGDRSVTYAELHDRALRLASVLRDRGCDPGDRVALLVPKSIEAIVGMLGSLHAGAIYVPLDPGSPAARLRRIVDSCEPRWVLAAGGAVPKPGSLGDLPLGWLGPEERPEGCAFGTGDLREAPAASPDQRVGPDDPAHILFTSGSTGLPKGVVITHRNVLHFVGWANEYFDVQPGQRNSGHSPLFFDLSSYDVYGTLAAGAELHLVPPSINLLPHKVAAFIRERRLNLWFSVPTVLNQLAKAEVLEPGDLPDLRQVLWCGEVLPLPALRYWMERLPEVRFTNLYGPTEATIASSYYSLKTPPPGPEIPIGRACADEELMVLDGEMQPAPPSEAGDLYIRGPGLSPGYWRDRARTSEVFLDDPGGRMYRTGDRARIDGDGLVYFLGRADSQIKSRGYRIELGEIEWALQTMDCLRESAVVALATDGFEGHRICCAYVLREGEVETAVMRRELSTQIPSYMIPSRFLQMDRLPRTGNGKIDRKALQSRFEQPPDDRAGLPGARRAAGAGETA